MNEANLSYLVLSCCASSCLFDVVQLQFLVCDLTFSAKLLRHAAVNDRSVWKMLKNHNGNGNLLTLGIVNHENVNKQTNEMI